MDSKSEFFSVLRNRVNAYFKENNISRHGDYRMYIKSAIMISLYVVPYFLILFQISDLIAVKFLLWVTMGIGLAGIGLGIMHDASHGAYSKSKKVNQRIASGIMTFIGGSEFNWNIQHNILHHSYTNIDGVDEDIDPGAVMRFSPHKKRYFIHRFQHLYAWLLYGLMTVTWSTNKDFRQLLGYKKDGMLDKQKAPFKKILWNIVIDKAIFHFATIGVPLIVLSDPWYLILSYVFMMHFVAGLIMACVFQPAHVVPDSKYPLPDGNGSMENNWAIHQLLTTANFSPNSRILSYYVGGLNYQIEHHLFPNICHIHYKEISKIVKNATSEFGLPYNVQKTFIGALYEHAKMLRILGRQDFIPEPSRVKA